jgi:hypothetical protein
MDDPKELAEKAMRGLVAAGKRSPSKRFAEMVKLGLIDREGRIAKALGGSATKTKPISSPKILST